VSVLSRRVKVSRFFHQLSAEVSSSDVLIQDGETYERFSQYLGLCSHLFRFRFLVVGFRGDISTMKKSTIEAGSLMAFQKFLRDTNGILIRAKPFMNAQRQECYLCLYMGEQYGV
jgi:hypothetical protein